MTITPTDPLAEALAARKAAETVNGTPPPPHDPATGEIVPVPVEPPKPPAEVVTDFSYVPAKVVGGLPYARDYMKLATTIKGTEMVPDAFRNRPDAIMAAFLRGYELGFGPMQALDSLNVIKGKVGLSAEAMRALIMGHGHQIIIEATTTEATAECRRSDWPADKWVTVTWDLADAKRAQLPWANGGGKYPRAMLSARVTSEAARLYFPDVIAGMSYTPEEIADFTDRPARPAPAPTAAPPREVPTTSPEPSDPSSASCVAAADAHPGGPADTEPPEAAEADPVPTPAKKAARARKAPSRPSEGQSDDATERRELVKGLNAVIAGLPRPQQSLVRGYLAQHGMGDLSALTAEQIIEACRIAAGWPTSVAGDDPQGGDDAVDGEVTVEDVAEAFGAEVVDAQLIQDAEVVNEPPEGWL